MFSICVRLVHSNIQTLNSERDSGSCVFDVLQLPSRY